MVGTYVKRPAMRIFFILLSTLFLPALVVGQGYYTKASNSFHLNQIDSARYYINKNLSKRPTADDYFLSAMIHESAGAPLRALADYEALVKQEDNIEAYFQKGLIYLNSASYSKAIADFSYVIQNIDKSETRAVYFANDPIGRKGTFITTLQSLKGKVYQYRGMAYQNTLEWDLALQDFNTSLEFDSTADVFINRSQVYSKMGKDNLAISDLEKAISIDPENYLAWYNLALLDESARLPDKLLEDKTFSPMLNLMGANAYESKAYQLSIEYYSKSLENNSMDDLAFVGRGKALLRIKSYGQARADFIKALQLNPKRTEAFYLIGNSFFYQASYEEAISFYEQYLSIDPFYENVWYNAAMSYLSTKEKDKACNYLKKAADLGMSQAIEMLTKHCDSQ